MPATSGRSWSRSCPQATTGATGGGNAAPHIAHLDEGTIEGGDIILHTGTVRVGLGEETSPAGVRARQRALPATASPGRSARSTSLSTASPTWTTTSRSSLPAPR
ncbi:hypothetical protein [Streptomyces albidochromogenes]|uniref:Uncharacterized protein n=1 Tax=Streptomyces albidochromogenes TaxID=329524 RepID=A0ABW6FJJ1_9ACTN